MNINDIVNKTKRMLGKNYRGDRELVPVYSNLFPIEGHTDAFAVISNGGFTNDEVALIKEKTRNYAWWVAMHGYLVDNTMHDFPALIIYGSEVGTPVPDILNFNGVTANNFYVPIDRTNMTGDVNNTSNHVYVQFLLDGELITSEADIPGTPSLIDDYAIYAGRLYPEDRRVQNGNIVYPIYLISNLEYYYNTSEALNGAHDTEPEERNNLEILEDVCEMVVSEAAQWTNRNINTKLLNDCWPVIVKCACSAYLNRGAENLNSQSELGQQNVYTDWVTVMHKQLTNRRYVL